jgi:hypothetical protein
MANFISMQPFLYETQKKNILFNIDSVKNNIYVLEKTIEENPELLFKNLSVEYKSETKILTRINNYKSQLQQYQTELLQINKNLEIIGREKQGMNEMECINKKNE